MNKNIFNWLFFFIFGVWLAKNFSEKVERVQKYRLPIYLGTLISMVVVILTPFFTGEVFDYNLALASTRASVIVYSILLVLTVMVVRMDRLFFRQTLLKLSKYSFYIYLSHYLFVHLWRDLYGALDLSWVSGVYILVALIVVTIPSYIIGVWMKKAEKTIGI